MHKIDEKKEENKNQSNKSGDDESSFHQQGDQGDKCHVCEDVNHMVKECFARNKILKNEWHKNANQRSEVLREQGTSDANTEETGSDDTSLSLIKTDLTDKLEKVLSSKKLSQMRDVRHCDVHVSCNFTQSISDELAKVMLSNNESSHSIFCDHRFVKNIEKALNALTLHIDDDNVIIDETATLS